jgi:hypothetical protein
MSAAVRSWLIYSTESLVQLRHNPFECYANGGPWIAGSAHNMETSENILLLTNGIYIQESRSNGDLYPYNGLLGYDTMNQNCAMSTYHNTIYNPAHT